MSELSNHRAKENVGKGSSFKPNGSPPVTGGSPIAAYLKERQYAQESNRFWDDPDFQDNLIALLVSDQKTLESCGELLSPEDFRPPKETGEKGRARWIVAERALEFYNKHKAPIGSLLRSDVLKHATKTLSLGVEKLRDLKEYVEKIHALKPVAHDALVENVILFKSQVLKRAAVDELIDHIAAGTDTDEKWREICLKATSAGTYGSGKSLIDAPQWPKPLTEAAYHGLAGDVVRAIEPHTEADPAAILIQFLIAFGNLCGHHAYWQVEATRHYLNLFAVLVGATSKARKGTSWDRVMNLFEDKDLDLDWLSTRRMGGLSTGEGLIKEVRNPSFKRNKDGGLVIDDPGVEDKRLLIVEPEFARVLKVGDRDAATLPAILRDAWDKGDLRTMTKESPLCATGAHISMIGHITNDELQRTLSDTNRSNGFANRFLWVCVQRSQKLPEGGPALQSKIRRGLILRILAASQHAAKVRRMSLSTLSKPLWAKVYPELSEGRLGILGATTDRAEAQVRRIACIYALLDGKSFVQEVHLLAALEVWRYCFDSARFIFGTTTGDPIAEAILKDLRRRGGEGLSRNTIRVDLFQQNKSSEAIGHALDGLRKKGLARCALLPSAGAGRPAEMWYAV